MKVNGLSLTDLNLVCVVNIPTLFTIYLTYAHRIDWHMSHPGRSATAMAFAIKPSFVLANK